MGYLGAACSGPQQHPLKQKLFSLIYFHLFISDFIAFDFDVKYKYLLQRPMSKSLPPVFSSRGFMVSGVMLKYESILS